MSEDLTIAIPVCNRHEYFRTALDSALAQTVSVAVLVVDNASTAFDFERAVRELGDARIRYHRNPANLGMVGNWNQCLRLADTRWVSILHDDDALYPRAVDLLLKAMEELPGRGLYYGLDDVMDEAGRTSRNKNEDGPFCETIAPATYALRNQFAACGFAIERDRALGIAGYDARLSMTPDWDLYYRMCARFGAVRINRIISAYREPTQRPSITSTMALSGMLLPSLALQRARNLRDHAKLTGQPITASHRVGQAGMAQQLLGEIGWRMSRRGQRTARLYAELELPQNRWKALAYRISPKLFSGLMIEFSRVKNVWRGFAS